MGVDTVMEGVVLTQSVASPKRRRASLVFPGLSGGRDVGSVWRKTKVNREARVEVDRRPTRLLSVARTQPRAWLRAASHGPHGLPLLSWPPSPLHTILRSVPTCLQKELLWIQTSGHLYSSGSKAGEVGTSRLPNCI